MMILPGQPDSAQTMFRKCLKYVNDRNMAVAAFRGLSLLYEKIGPADSTAKYALLAYNANDSAHQKKVGEALIRQQAIYNYSKHEEEALKNAERATTLWRWLFGAFVAIVLKNVKEHPTSKDWDKLCRFAKSKLPKLYVMLRNYNVSEREMRICLLTRLMFKPKDIAVLVGCRFPEVSLTRSRLLKKIYGIDGKSSDFDKRIMLMY